MKLKQHLCLKDNFISNSLFLLLCFSVFVSLAVRVYCVNSQFWMDELATSWVISDGFTAIFERSWLNNLSPAYFVFPYISQFFLGVSEPSLRLPSIIFSLLTAIVVFKLAMELTKSRRISYFSALFVLIDKDLVYFSLDARPYSLSILATSLFLLYFFRHINNPKNISNLVIWIFLGTISIYIHYTNALLFVSLSLAVTINMLFPDRRKHYSMIFLSLLLVAFLCLPLASHLYNLFSIRKELGSFLPQPNPSQMFSIIPHVRYYIIIPLAAVFFYTFSYRQKLFKTTSESPYKTYHISLVIFLVLFSVLLIFSLAYAGIVNIYLPRYLSWTFPLVIILSSLILEKLNGKRLKTIFIFTIIILQLSASYKIVNSRKNVTNNSWENIVYELNISTNSTYILFYPPLIERKMAGDLAKYNPDDLFMSYLTSPLNSIYKLDKNKLNDLFLTNGNVDICLLPHEFFAINIKLDSLERTEHWKTENIAPSIHFPTLLKYTRLPHTSKNAPFCD